MSLRGAMNFVRRAHTRAGVEARSPDLTAAALGEDVVFARERVARLRQLLAGAERTLAQRVWELEVYALHGMAPKRKGLAKRVAEMARVAKQWAMRKPDPRGGWWS